MKKEYLEIDGLVHKDNWTEEDKDNFIDEFVSLVEKYEATAATSFKLLSEDELED